MKKIYKILEKLFYGLSYIFFVLGTLCDKAEDYFCNKKKNSK